jgi:hypothetical protein
VVAPVAVAKQLAQRVQHLSIWFQKTKPPLQWWRGLGVV